MKKKLLGLVIAGLLVLAGVIILNYWPASKRDERVLKIGMMSGWAPFMTLNAQGQYEGFDIDVAQALAQKMGKRLEIVDFGSLAPLFLALEQGAIDAAMSGLDITHERLQKVAMVPYVGSGFDRFYLLFWQQVPRDVRTLEDLTKRKAIIAVEPGSASQTFLKQYPEIEPKLLSGVSDMIMDVQYGRSLAAIVEPLVARRLQKQTPELTSLAIPLPPTFCVYGTGIAVRKDRRALTQAIQQTIDALKRDATITRLAKRWGIEDV